MMRRGCIVLVLGGLWGCPQNDVGKAPPCTTFAVWADADGDGWGGESLEPACELADGQVDRGQDCDDDDDEIHPDADEACDGVDNNCNGELDDGLDDLGVEQGRPAPWDRAGGDRRVDQHGGRAAPWVRAGPQQPSVVRRHHSRHAVHR